MNHWFEFVWVSYNDLNKFSLVKESKSVGRRKAKTKPSGSDSVGLKRIARDHSGAEWVP